MGNPKDLKNYIPILADQGIKNLVGSPAKGVSIQVLAAVEMPADGIFVFADNGLENMAEAGAYAVIVQNHTDPADEATCLAAARLGTQITLTGPDTSDVLDILIIGQVSGQLA